MKFTKKYAFHSMIPVYAVLFWIGLYMVFNQRAVGDVERNYSRVTENYMKANTLAAELKQSISSVQHEILLACATGSENGLVSEGINRENVHNKAQELAACIPEKAEEIAALEKAFDHFDEVGTGVSDTYRLTGRTGGNKKMPEFLDAAGEMFQEIDDIIVYVADRVEKENAQVGTSIGFLDKIMMLFIVAVIVTMIIVYLLNIRKTTKDIKEIVAAVSRMAGNDMTVEPLGKSRMLELQELRFGINGLIEDLRGMLTTIQASSIEVSFETASMKEGSEEIARSMSEIADNMGRMAEGIASQAEDAENITNDVESLSQVVLESKDVANTLNEESGKISGMSKEGLKVVGELSRTTVESGKAFEVLIENIGSISESTQKISSASGLIEDIASQTNLLSLNASIEAARAGELGRGFAVVAQEVGHLAEQSSQTVKEIEDMIAGLQSSVESAVRYVDTARQLMEEQYMNVKATEEKYETISASVDSMGDSIGEINIIGDAMSEFCDTVSTAVTNLSHLSEQNASATQETSAATEEILATTESFREGSLNLEEKAKLLKEMAAKFQV